MIVNFDIRNNWLVTAKLSGEIRSYKRHTEHFLPVEFLLPNN